MWELELRTGDRLLLCSDGLTNEVGSDELAGILGQVDDPGEAAHQLVEAANRHGGADNITVVVVDVQVGEDGDDTALKVTPLALGAASVLTPLAATAAVPAVEPAAGNDEPEPADHGDAGPHPSAASEESDATGVVPAVAADETLAPGARLVFGDQTGTLAEAGPQSDDKPEGKESRGARRRRLGIPRRITPRVIGFVILVAAVPVAAYYVLKWYAYDNWIVTSQGEQIVVKQGQPGGVLWFHPKVVDRTAFTTGDVAPAAVGALRAGVQRPSLQAARSYVTSITTTTTTTTTVQHSTTVPLPPSATTTSTTPLATPTTVPAPKPTVAP
jgi:protein phosphatase